ncbi:DUF3347 domain-containing protein [Sediminibacterium sp.]|uniref:DUF3347 domain-containing protein n=1 Tax=Sediminibacterium sp. TaxID=1917865 RepID=UPI0025DB3636|nr:DUF3347 domain-containing protein [Sediminibacterium sp.]MBW0176655.1 DUF3347 domain-containing protein [Sediminibacterium sp.]
MKKLLFFYFLLIAQIAVGQVKHLNPVLKNYLEIKNELVSGNTANSKKAAVALKEFTDAASTKNMDTDAWKAFSQVKVKMSDHLSAFIAAKDIQQQREIFSGLSDLMIQLAKSISIGETELYVDYCPMKKVFWLSADKAIRNPYYGNMMLSCGNIKETIKH